MSPNRYLSTGQRTCHGDDGLEMPCIGSGQDASFDVGIPWPQPRFFIQNQVVLDALTGLSWSMDASMAEFPLTWQESLDFVARLNQVRHLGRQDWRLPNRRELRSLLSFQTKKPALPEAHPFTRVFNGWYWSSTTAAISPAHAWYVALDGARMFYGGKDQSFMLWPVCGAGSDVIPETGQIRCYDARGQEIPCQGTGQDGEYRYGAKWPEPRFETLQQGVVDRVSGLLWRHAANLTSRPVKWRDALSAVRQLNAGQSDVVWRLPTINELESLVDCAAHSPALPCAHPFTDLRDTYWSSTTSLYEPDWAWALYLQKGATGIGQKHFAEFAVWPVSSSTRVGRL